MDLKNVMLCLALFALCLFISAASAMPKPQDGDDEGETLAFNRPEGAASDTGLGGYNGEGYNVEGRENLGGGYGPAMDHYRGAEEQSGEEQEE